MKNILSIILIIQFTSFCNSQKLLESILPEDAVLITREPFNYKITNSKYDIDSRLNSLREQRLHSKNDDILIDSIIVKKLCLKAENLDSTLWKPNELLNSYLTTHSKLLNFKEITTYLKIDDKGKLKELRKKINQYKYEPHKWRSYPISLSRPVYTDDRNYALVIFKYDNNGGEINIYRLINNKWIFAGRIENWSY